MRTRSMVLAVTALLLAAGCNGNKAKDLTKKDTEILKSINESFYETSAAVDMALGSKVFPLSRPEKVAKLAEMISATHCERDNDGGEPGGFGRYPSDWGATQKISPRNGPCTLSLNQREEYRAVSRELSIYEKFDTSGDFKNESVVQSYLIQGGMKAQDQNGQTRIRGYWEYKNFRVKDIGLLAVRIRTEQSYNEMGGGGSVLMTIEGNGMDHSVIVNWSNRGDFRYRINGKKADEATVQALFSAYGLTEIVDRSQRMR